MHRVRTQVARISTTNQSRVTNGTRLLDGIDGRSAIARRLRDILHGLLIEFEIETPADEILIRQAATLSVISEQLQTQIVNGELVDCMTVTNLSGQLRRILGDLRKRNGQRGPAPPSLHEHLATFGTRLGDDEDGDQ